MNTQRCGRCREELTAWSTGYFTNEDLCLECIEDEKHAPGYAEAVNAEEDAVRKGNYNFPGIGLSREAKAFLERKVQERKAHIIR